MTQGRELTTAPPRMTQGPGQGAGRRRAAVPPARQGVLEGRTGGGLATRGRVAGGDGSRQGWVSSGSRPLGYSGGVAETGYPWESAGSWQIRAMVLEAF